MSDSLNYVDLFCGIGGFHLALDKVNANCILSCDTDKKCRESYFVNFGMEPEGDVRKIDFSQIGNVDIICGGFPCQPFSNAGKKLTLSDDRGLLFDEIMKIAKMKNPKFLFLENVKHILKVGDGEVFKYIRAKINAHGYYLQLFQMSPHNYGIPQQRERIYFVCVRNDIYNGNDVCLKKESNIPIEFEKFLDKKEDINEKYYLKGDLLQVLEAWDEMIKEFAVDEKISPTILVNEFYKTYTNKEFEDLALWRKDYITKNKPLYNKYKDKWDSWYTKYSDLLSKREVYCKLEWQVGPIKPNDSIFNYFIQIRQSGIRVRRAQYFPTLVAISQIPIYGKEKRYITPRECIRLQSFPEDYSIDENDRVVYKQAGNAVNVDNASNVILSTLSHYNYIE